MIVTLADDDIYADAFDLAVDRLRSTNDKNICDIDCRHIDVGLLDSFNVSTDANPEPVTKAK